MNRSNPLQVQKESSHLGSSGEKERGELSNTWRRDLKADRKSNSYTVGIATNTQDRGGWWLMSGNVWRPISQMGTQAPAQYCKKMYGEFLC